MQARRKRTDLTPFIIIAVGVGLLLMLLALRPQRGASVPAATAAATSGVPSSNEISVLLNGQPLSAYQPARLKPTALGDPSTWQLGDIAQFAARGPRTVLIFRDGSVADVTSSVYRRLPGNIRVRIDYDRSY